MEGGGGGHFFPALQFGLILMQGGGRGGGGYLGSATDFYEYGRFPFVRIDRPDLFGRNDNQFPFNQNSPARSVKS